MKTIKLSVIILLAAWATSCNLDQYPYSETAADEYVKDASSVNNLLIGCYNALQSTMNYEWALTELRSDNARVFSANSSSDGHLLGTQFDQETILTANLWVQNYWESTYAAINRSNTVLASLGVVSDKALYNQYKGEAEFLRAYHYFNLVRLWGPVFIVTKKTGADEARKMQRSTVNDVYTLIENDLTDIVNNNLLPTTYETANLGRATLTAAKALLAKVYMTHYSAGDEKYAEAKTLISDVIAAAGNPTSASQLVPYDKIFSIDNEMNAEIIFAVRYKAGNLGLGSPFGNFFAPINNGGYVISFSTYNYNRPTDELIARFDANATTTTVDARKAVCLSEQYYNPTTEKWISAIYTTKYLSPVTAQNDGESDWPVIRLGDILLLYAEISNELSGPTAEALNALNMIRTRAKVTPYTLAQLNSRYLFRQAVRDERRLELALENQRWFDLLRWGIAAETMSSHLAAEAFYSDYTPSINTKIEQWQTMLPIPTSVININPDVAQNVGY